LKSGRYSGTPVGHRGVGALDQRLGHIRGEQQHHQYGKPGRNPAQPILPYTIAAARLLRAGLFHDFCSQFRLASMNFV
jgi:hypothetical protein